MIANLVQKCRRSWLAWMPLLALTLCIGCSTNSSDPFRSSCSLGVAEFANASWSAQATGGTLSLFGAFGGGGIRVDAHCGDFVTALVDGQRVVMTPDPHAATTGILSLHHIASLPAPDHAATVVFRLERHGQTAPLELARAFVPAPFALGVPNIGPGPAGGPALELGFTLTPPLPVDVTPITASTTLITVAVTGSCYPQTAHLSPPCWPGSALLVQPGNAVVAAKGAVRAPLASREAGSASECDLDVHVRAITVGEVLPPVPATTSWFSSGSSVCTLAALTGTEGSRHVHIPVHLKW
jgi:hypothetical protein